MAVTSLYSWTVGQVLTASQMTTYINANFSALDVTTTKGDIAAASSGSALGRLAVGTDDYYLQALASATLGVTYGMAIAVKKRSFAGSVNATASETELDHYTIPANSLYASSTNFGYRMRFGVRTKNTSGAGITPTYKAYYNTTTLWSFAYASIANNAYGLIFGEVFIRGKGATNAQYAHAEHFASNAALGTGASNNGQGTLTEPTEDSTQALSFALKVTHPSNNANITTETMYLEWDKLYAG